MTVLKNTKCLAVTEEGVSAETPEGEKLIPADTVVIAVGLRPNSREAEALRDCAPIFIPIGNCVAPSQVQGAIRSGYDAAAFQI
ncbi:MAG: hypothetical protein IKR21_05055 [Oscillospiraceae bacterium]|nr:hypothetical protein [Oscillospiraceae bacterium]